MRPWMVQREVPPNPAPGPYPMEYFLGMDPKGVPVQALCCPGRSLRSPWVNPSSSPGPWSGSRASFRELRMFPGSIGLRGALTQAKTRSGGRDLKSSEASSSSLPSSLCGMPVADLIPGSCSVPDSRPRNVPGHTSAPCPMETPGFPREKENWGVSPTGSSWELNPAALPSFPSLMAQPSDSDPSISPLPKKKKKIKIRSRSPTHHESQRSPNIPTKGNIPKKKIKERGGRATHASVRRDRVGFLGSRAERGEDRAPFIGSRLGLDRSHPLWTLS